MRIGPLVLLPKIPLSTPLSKSAIFDLGTKRFSHGCGTSHKPLDRSFNSALWTRSKKSTYGRSVVKTDAGMKFNFFINDSTSCISVTSQSFEFKTLKNITKKKKNKKTFPKRSTKRKRKRLLPNQNSCFCQDKSDCNRLIFNYLRRRIFCWVIDWNAQLY